MWSLMFGVLAAAAQADSDPAAASERWALVVTGSKTFDNCAL